MKTKFTLYSNFWATVLMAILFLFSSLSGFRFGGSEPLSSDPDLRRNIYSGTQALNGQVVILDPGHGGADPGTIGVGPTTEAENVLAIAWELKALLERAGAKVIMTRQADLTPVQGNAFDGQGGQLAARVAKANRSGGRVFISLHNDWSDNPGVAGTSVYYYKAQDLALAEALQKSIVRQLNSVDLGIRHENFYVLRNTNMPAGLVEVGFLSNPEEAALLSKPSYRLEVARGLFYGICEYFQS